jgi:formamidopyrimidine-DNA glycosylase
VPEGHTLHRLARAQQKTFGGQVIALSSPQGRFVTGAELLDGRRLVRVEAFGKHLFQHYQGAPALHVHLGLYGKFTIGSGEPPEPQGALRLRMVTDDAWSDLRGPTACELMDPPAVDALRKRLGPDPLAVGSDAGLAYRKIARSRVAIAALLMDQSVLAGIGNVYRAEILFRHRLDPFRPGASIDPALWSDLWSDLVVLMRAGVRTGRIETVRPEHRPRIRGPLSRAEAGYVYRRNGLPCRVCETLITTTELVGRNLFWCPSCQAPA